MRTYNYNTPKGKNWLKVLIIGMLIIITLSMFSVFIFREIISETKYFGLILSLINASIIFSWRFFFSHPVADYFFKKK